jgi:Predicted endonuclease distantly related to archaeal Holliday junction resolvase and Mrr-like restriction enzymes
VRAEHAERWFDHIWNVVTNTENLERIRCELLAEHFAKKLGRVVTAGILKPRGKVKEGTLIQVVAPAWKSVTEILQFDCHALYRLSGRQLEELIAAAYARVGFDRVILTPRSGDHGRDVIAEKDGIGAVRIVVQVKAYAAKNLVSADEVRSLIGVHVSEPAGTKAILTTTSDFAPRVRQAPNIAPLLGTSLQLINGSELVEKLVQTEYSKRGIAILS